MEGGGGAFQIPSFDENQVLLLTINSYYLWVVYHNYNVIFHFLLVCGIYFFFFFLTVGHFEQLVYHQCAKL